MKNILVIVLLCGIILACNQKPSFPLEPAITYGKITNLPISISNDKKPPFKDSVTITINYRDGDGDLGISNEEIKKQSEEGKFNYIVKRQLRVKGKYYDFDPTPRHSGNFITLKSAGKPGPIEGFINYAIDFFPLNGTKKDTIKFQITIVDRMGHSSNTVTTDSILVNELNKKTLVIK